MLGNKSKRVMALAVSAAMLLPMMSLAACKKKGASGSDSEGSSGSAKTSSEAAGKDSSEDPSGDETKSTSS